MKGSKTNFNFHTIIHTVQMLSTNIFLPAESLAIVNTKPYIIKPTARLTRQGYLFPINANKFQGMTLKSLTEFSNIMPQIQADLNISSWEFNRVDFAFDTPLKYDNIFKSSLYIVCLLSAATGIKNAFKITDINTKKERALTLKNQSFEFQIYDKALESENKHPYTRFEFRFKNLHYTSAEALIHPLQNLIISLPDYIETVEQQRINDLYALWQKENKANSAIQTKHFSEFIRRHSDDIFTRNIAKGLYAKIHSGNFNSWIKWFRRTNCIHFITKSEVENISKEMKTSLYTYIGKG